MSTPRFLADEDLRHRIVLATRRLEPTLEFATAEGLVLIWAASQAEEWEGRIVYLPL